MQKFFSLVKFTHTIFAMPFALIGFFMAVWVFETDFSWWLLLKVILAMVFARNSAMGFNRYSDREIDAKNVRTENREIPSGKISVRSVRVFIILNILAFIITTWFINPLCFYLSFVALAVVLGYSLTKHFTWLCHFILGIGLSLAPIGAFIAVTGYFSIAPVLLSFAVLCWVSGFDIIYALQDDDFDKEQGLFSIPSYFGRKNALLISRIVHFVSVLFVFFVGWLIQADWVYYIGAMVFATLLFYQQVIVSPNNLSKVNLSFFTTNGLASLVFAAIAIISFYY